MSGQVPGPGWFHDPGGSGQQRFWDGERWTNALRPDEDAADAALTRTRTSPARPSKPGGRTFWVVAGGLVVLALLVGGLWWFVEGRPPSGPLVEVGVEQHVPPADVEGRPPLGPLVEVGVEQHVPPADEARIYSVSPDGRTVLVPETEPGDGRVCIRSIDEPAARACVDAPRHLDTRGISWSADGRYAVLGDHFFISFEGGDFILVDVEAGTAEAVADAVPMTAETRDAGTFRVYVRPALSPDGRQLVAFRLLPDQQDIVQQDIVVFDVETGEERVLAPAPEGFFSLLWSPDGETVWASGFRRGELGSYALGISSSGSIDHELDTTVELAHVGPSGSQLVQVSTDRQVGLLLLSDALGRYRRPMVNTPYLAIIDLDTGTVAPVLPAGPDDPDAVDYAWLYGGRLSADGRFVNLVHGTSARTIDPDADVRVIRVPVESVFDGTDERQVVVDSLGRLLGLELPLNPANDTATWAAHPLPADGDALIVPVARPHTPDSRGGSSPDLFVVIRGDRPW